jgi:3-dehydroquinate dehydratase
MELELVTVPSRYFSPHNHSISATYPAFVHLSYASKRSSLRVQSQLEAICSDIVDGAGKRRKHAAIHGSRDVVFW